MKRLKAILLAAAVLAGVCCSAALAADGEPAKAPRRPARPGANVTVKVGQAAPDVALWPLTTATDANGQEIMKIAAEPVRLSDYKHKAPIVIFSSSYT